MALNPLSRAHAKRLREIYRSAGWPCQDLLEIELLAAGLLERVYSSSDHETPRVTDRGLVHLAHVHAHNRFALSKHETLVEQVAREMVRAGRSIWCGLGLRAQLPAETEDGPARWCKLKAQGPF